MGQCDVCGNDYDKAFRVTQGDRTMTFDSFDAPSTPWPPNAPTANAAWLATASRPRARSIAAPIALGRKASGASRTALPEASHDPQAQDRPVSPVLTEDQSEDGKTAQPRDVPDAGEGREARARCAVLQAPQRLMFRTLAHGARACRLARGPNTAPVQNQATRRSRPDQNPRACRRNRRLDARRAGSMPWFSGAVPSLPLSAMTIASALSRISGSITRETRSWLRSA